MIIKKSNIKCGGNYEARRMISSWYLINSQSKIKMNIWIETHSERMKRAKISEFMRWIKK
jgi:hypothetical protein